MVFCVCGRVYLRGVFIFPSVIKQQYCLKGRIQRLGQWFKCHSHRSLASSTKETRDAHACPALWRYSSHSWDVLTREYRDGSCMHSRVLLSSAHLPWEIHSKEFLFDSELWRSGSWKNNPITPMYRWVASITWRHD